MTPHKFVPVSQPIGYDGPTVWRCGCGLTRQDPTPRLTDDCARVELFEDGAA